MRIETEIKLDYKDVLIRPKRSTLKSRSQVSIERTYTFKHSQKTWSGVPIVSANMDTTGTLDMAAVLYKEKLFTTVCKQTSVEQWQKFEASHPEAMEFVAVSSGTSESDFQLLKDVMSKTKAWAICLDVANGYSEHFVHFLRKVRAEFPAATIIAGNVVTGEMTEELILSGADLVKVGIGPGSVCTTRKQTGVGYPQLSAVIECADAAHGLGGHIIADGGCTVPGDIAKAFGAGADFVMLGGMLAGHDQSAGELVERNGSKFKLFYGMSSATAMKKYKGGVAEYRASEGKTVMVPYRGCILDTIKTIKGGLRSACTYVGAVSIKEISKRTTFIRVTQQLNTVFGSTEVATDAGYKRSVEGGEENGAKRARK